MTTDTEFVIDRLEDGWAVLEDPAGRTFDLPRAWLPGGVREGDVLRVTRSDIEGGSDAAACALELRTDPGARRRREESVRRLHRRLRRGPEGDLSL